MKVRVQFFAGFRRLTGIERLEIELNEPCTVADVVEAVRTRFPALREFERSTLVAKGVEFAQPTEPVREGDEISLMPPVMGG